jgi:hypothetical protein
MFLPLPIVPMVTEEINIKFPLWPFLNQPLLDARHRLVLSPRKFSRLYHIAILEKCWHKQPVNRKRRYKF